MTGITAERVRARMDEMGIDQSELARRTGCSSAAINQIVNDKTQNSRFLPKIAGRLGVSLAWLLGESDEPFDVDAGDDYSEEEREWVELLRALRPHDRDTLIHLAQSLRQSARSGPTLHQPARDYRAEKPAD